MKNTKSGHKYITVSKYGRYKVTLPGRKYLGSYKDLSDAIKARDQCVKLTDKIGKKGPPRVDLSDKTFGKLKAKSRVNKYQWFCECKCGNTTVVDGSYLTSGIVQSCGCGKGGRKGVKRWTEKEEKLLLNLYADGLDMKSIASHLNRGVAAIHKRFSTIKDDWVIKRCHADGCKERLFSKNPNVKYCSDRCRYRDNKQKTYKRRKQEGLCQQCGGEMPENQKRTYCQKCKEYFNGRYQKIKEGDIKRIEESET